MSGVHDGSWMQLDHEQSFAEQPHDFVAAPDDDMGHSISTQPLGGEALTSLDLWDGSFPAASGFPWDQGTTLQEVNIHDNIALAALWHQISYSENPVGNTSLSSSAILQDSVPTASHVLAEGPDSTSRMNQQSTLKQTAAILIGAAEDRFNNTLIS
jgi:hypothetical protein